MTINYTILYYYTSIGANVIESVSGQLDSHSNPKVYRRTIEKDTHRDRLRLCFLRTQRKTVCDERGASGTSGEDTTRQTGECFIHINQERKTKRVLISCHWSNKEADGTLRRGFQWRSRLDRITFELSKETGQ